MLYHPATRGLIMFLLPLGSRPDDIAVWLLAVIVGALIYSKSKAQEKSR